MKELDDVTGAIVDASVHIHMELGPGLLESVYEAVLARALEKRGFRVERQKAIRFEYDGMVFEEGFRIDLLVEGRVVVELKSLEKLAPVHGKQVLTYLRLRTVHRLARPQAGTPKRDHRLLRRPHLDEQEGPQRPRGL